MNKILLIIFSFISTVSFAQNSISTDQWYSKDNSDSKVSYDANVRYNVNMGTSFSSFGRNMNGYNYYVAPSASIPVGKKTHLTVGLVMNQSHYSGLMMGEGGLQNRTISQTQAIVYMSGSYQINPNVTVFASGYYDMNSRNNSQVIRNPYSPYGSEGFSVGAEFKIGEKTRIGIQVQYDKGGNPYANPYGGFGMGNRGTMRMGNPFGMY